MCAVRVFAFAVFGSEEGLLEYDLSGDDRHGLLVGFCRCRCVRRLLSTWHFVLVWLRLVGCWLSVNTVVFARSETYGKLLGEKEILEWVVDNWFIFDSALWLISSLFARVSSYMRSPAGQAVQKKLWMGIVEDMRKVTTSPPVFRWARGFKLVVLHGQVSLEWERLFCFFYEFNLLEALEMICAKLGDTGNTISLEYLDGASLQRYFFHQAREDYVSSIFC